MPHRPSASSSSPVSRALLVSAAALVMLAAHPAMSQAAGPGKTHHHRLKVMVVDPKPTRGTPGEAKKMTERQKHQRSEVRRLKKRKLAERAAGLIRRRLHSAGIKMVSVDVKPHGTVAVSAHTNRSRKWLQRVILPPGKTSVRPVLRRGKLWAQLASALPAGVKLKRGAASDLSDAYLWCDRAEPLRKFARRLAMPDVKLRVMRVSDGWRLQALGAPTLNEGHIGQSRVTLSHTGAPHAQLTLNSEGLRRLASVPTTQLDFALELDGEIIDVLNLPPNQRGLPLRVRCPSWLGQSDAQRACVEMVAGRTSAYIPVPLVVLD